MMKPRHGKIRTVRRFTSGRPDGFHHGLPAAAAAAAEAAAAAAEAAAAEAAALLHSLSRTGVKLTHLTRTLPALTV